jgi:uncharacterized protein YqjF (DUF2071 family)
VPHPALAVTDHRPWPLPRGPWIWSQEWRDLLFAHWRFPPERLSALLPPGVEIDLFEGSAWVTVVPFRMANVRPRWLPAVPRLSHFPELNVRTYVKRDGKPGVFFLSIDAGRRSSAWLARALTHLPYRFADIRFEQRNGRFEFEAGLPHGQLFSASYQSTGASRPARAGHEHWLIERYCLYAADRSGGLYRAEIHHQPWPLCDVSSIVETNHVLPGDAAAEPHAPTLVHASAGVDVVAWSFTALP